jgi:type III pantothenate kinase
MSGEMLIAVDIGNSSTKLGWFGPEQIQAVMPQPSMVQDFPTGRSPPDHIAAELGQQPLRWRVASVNRAGQQALAQWVSANRPQDDLQVLSHRDLPIAVNVEHPERVGVDRLAAALAAFAANAIRDPGRPVIVVDAGTAVTVDLVSSDGAFEGGAILAGFRMQTEALFQTADLLPLTHLAPQDEPPPVLGKDTEAAIRSGLFWGSVGAVRELVERMAEGRAPPPQVFVTGGDLRQLAAALGGQTRFVPHMVLAGIAIAERARHAPPGKTA